MKPLTAVAFILAELGFAGYAAWQLIAPPYKPNDWALVGLVILWGGLALGTAYVGLIRPALLKRKAGEGRG